MKNRLKAGVCAVTALALLLSTGCQRPAGKVSGGEAVLSETSLLLKKESQIPLKEEDILPFLSHGTGVLFFTWKECPWCREYEKILTESLTEFNLPVYTYDIYEDRQKETELYRKVTERLSPYLSLSGAFDSTGSPRIYVPTAVFMVEGDIVGFDNTSSMETDSSEIAIRDFWEKEEMGKSRKERLMESFSVSLCQICKKQKEIENRGCNKSCAVKIINGTE